MTMPQLESLLCSGSWLVLLVLLEGLAIGHCRRGNVQVDQKGPGSSTYSTEKDYERETGILHLIKGWS